jgi:glycosyltransferase involved in cell wall biosynthesis
MGSREVTLDIFPALFPAGGIGRYVRDLAYALRNVEGRPKARFAYPRNLRSKALAAFRPDELHELPLPSKALHALFMAGNMLGLHFDGLYGDPALVHSPAGYGPLFRRARLVVNVHDLTFLDHPEWHPRRTWLYYGATLPQATRNATAVICHSDYVRRLVIDRYAIDPARAVTLSPPLGHDFHPMSPVASRDHVERRFGVRGDFILHVGTIEPRKNHVGLVQAFERICRAGFPGPLVFVGQDGWHVGPILARIERSSEARRIIRIRDADDHDLAALYGACTVCAYPSFEEGFGMPLLEGMACAAPCLTSDHPVLLELGRECAWTVPACDVEALTERMLALWRDPDARLALGEKGPGRAANYAYEQWARRTFALYEAVLSTGMPPTGADRPSIAA